MAYIKDIRFWIAVFFLLRLFNITQPPLEKAHNWRQVTGMMTARNFVEVDNNILYPRLDFAGGNAGIAGMEFPLLNYGHYLMAELFGYDHWYGRLLNLLLSSIGIWYFFKILKRFFGEEHAFTSSILLLSSLWFLYSRKAMPDIFSISLCLMGLYYGLRYLYDQKSIKNLVLYSLFACLGILSKIPSAYLFLIFIIPILDKAIDKGKKIWIVSASIVVLAPSMWWYFYWVPYLNTTYGLDHYFMGVSFAQGVSDIFSNFGKTLKRFYAEAIGYFGFVIFLIGLIYAVVKRKKEILVPFGISSIGFLVFMFKAGENFPHHSYYILPYVPIIAFVLGWFIIQMNKKVLMISVMLIIGFENIANQQHDFFTKDSELHKLRLEGLMDQYSEKEDLVAVSGSPNPQEIYFSHRKGWIYNESEVDDPDFLSKIRNGGCKLIVLNKHHFGQRFSNIELIHEDADYLIYTLN